MELLKKRRRFEFGVYAAIAVVSIAVGIYIVLSSHAATPQPTAPISAMAIVDGQDAPLLQAGTSQYKYVILKPAMYSDVTAIKAANPNTKVLVYKNVGFMTNACGEYPRLATGLDRCQADDGHTDWYLKQNGSEFTSCDAPWYYWADPGNVSYQNQWLSEVTSSAKADGFDGVFMDDVNTHPGHCMDGGLSSYSDQAYGQAALSFMSKVGPALKASGLLVVPNVQATPWTSYQETLAEQIAPYTSAFFREHFMHWDAGSAGIFTGPNWDAVMMQMEHISAATGFVANTYNSSTSINTAEMTYGRASFLLGWNGGSSSAYQYHIDAAVDPYNLAWAADVGTPTNSRYQVGSAWRRDFTGGTVVVNPSATSSATVALGGSYTNASGATVTSVTLSSGTAAILKGSSVSKAGDINGDGSVNVIDLSTLLSRYGTSDSASDLNHNGTVDVFDLSILLTNYGK